MVVVGDLSSRNFGIIIAYLLPGLVCLFGLSAYSETVRDWLAATESRGPTVAGFLYVTLASLAAGLVSGAVRWAVLDTFLETDGVRRPSWDDQRLGDRLDAFNYIVENHFRYYQFYGNSLVCLPWAYLAHRLSSHKTNFSATTDLAVALLCLVLFAASRDALEKYFKRSVALLGSLEQENAMTNGNHDAGGEVKKPAPNAANQKPANTKSAPGERKQQTQK